MVIWFRWLFIQKKKKLRLPFSRRFVVTGKESALVLAVTFLSFRRSRVVATAFASARSSNDTLSSLFSLLSSSLFFFLSQRSLRFFVKKKEEEEERERRAQRLRGFFLSPNKCGDRVVEIEGKRKALSSTIGKNRELSTVQWSASASASARY